MSDPRLRIDLDGITLTPFPPDHENSQPVAIFRRRTPEGVLLQIPESGPFLVEWDYLSEHRLDLRSGILVLSFQSHYVREDPQGRWLGGRSLLHGKWSLNDVQESR